MIAQLQQLFRQKMAETTQKYVEIFKQNVVPGSEEAMLLQPENRALLHTYVKGFCRHQIFREALQAVFAVKRQELDTYFTDAYDLYNYYAAVETDKKLCDYLIKIHIENQGCYGELRADGKLSKELQDFLNLGSMLHDEAKKYQQYETDAMQACFGEIIVGVANILLSSRTYQNAQDKISRRATRSNDEATHLYHITLVLLHDFHDRFESFYDQTQSHVSRRNALDRILEACIEYNYPQHYLKMQLIIDMLWLKYEQVALEHLKILASHVVHAPAMYDARTKIVEDSCRAFYHHHNLTIANLALTDHYANTFSAYYNSHHDHDAQAGLLEGLATEAAHYGKVSHQSKGFLEMVFHYHQEKSRKVVHADNNDAKNGNKTICFIQ